jgi:AcrR family transcriptional regulator
MGGVAASRRNAPVGRRPRAADAAGRERLLDVAIGLFAQHGIANTTVAQIAKACHVTSAMVHYWFETREKLLDALVAERLAPTIRGVWESVGEAGTALEMVHALVTHLLDVTEKLPALPPLWLREIVQEGGQLRERVLEHIPRERIAQFRTAVVRAQGRGEIDRDVSADLLFISLLALVMLPQATAKIWRRVNPGVDIARPQLERHVMALVLHGLAGAKTAGARKSPRRAS